MGYRNLGDWLGEVAGFALPLVLGWVIFVQCGGCKAAMEPAAEATYLGQQLQCVDRSPTRELADECRRQVRARWGIAETAHDAGADR